MNKLLKYFIIVLTSYVVLSCNKEQNDFQLSSKFNEIVSKYENSNDSKCICADDIINYPEPWTEVVADTFIISNEKLKNTSTCGLIQSFFNQPWNILGPWCSVCSDNSIDGMQYFNNRIKEDEILHDLFNRGNVLNKLITTYIELIQDLKLLQNHPGRLHCFEILLSSKKVTIVLNENVANELIVLSLKMIKEKESNSEFHNLNSIAATRHIIVNILIKYNFKPFIDDCTVNGTLETNLNGYVICYDDVKVENYAYLYLKNLKL